MVSVTVVRLLHDFVIMISTLRCCNGILGIPRVPSLLNRECMTLMIRYELESSGENVMFRKSTFLLFFSEELHSLWVLKLVIMRVWKPHNDLWIELNPNLNLSLSWQ